MRRRSSLHNMRSQLAWRVACGSGMLSCSRHHHQRCAATSSLIGLQRCMRTTPFGTRNGYHNGFESLSMHACSVDSNLIRFCSNPRGEKAPRTGW